MLLGVLTMPGFGNMRLGSLLQPRSQTQTNAAATANAADADENGGVQTGQATASVTVITAGNMDIVTTETVYVEAEPGETTVEQTVESAPESGLVSQFFSRIFRTRR